MFDAFIVYLLLFVLRVLIGKESPEGQMRLAQVGTFCFGLKKNDTEKRNEIDFMKDPQV